MQSNDTIFYNIWKNQNVDAMNGGGGGGEKKKKGGVYMALMA